MNMGKKEYVLKVKKSRKSHLVYYLMILAIILILSYLSLNGYQMGGFVFIISGLFVFGILAFIEVNHAREWWAITNSSLIHSFSILNKNVREVDFSSISDLDLDQPLLKRMLNYGDVNVRLFLNETSICIKNINSPKLFIETLQGLMAERGGKKVGIRKI